MSGNEQPSREPHIPYPADVAFVGALCLEVVEYREILARHLRANDAQVLPYHLLWDISEWVVARVSEHGQTDAVANAALSFCENQFERISAGVDNLISVGLLEPLLFGSDPEERLVQMLGSRLRADFESMKAWKPSWN